MMIIIVIAIVIVLKGSCIRGLLEQHAHIMKNIAKERKYKGLHAHWCLAFQNGSHSVVLLPLDFEAVFRVTRERTVKRHVNLMIGKAIRAWQALGTRILQSSHINV